MMDISPTFHPRSRPRPDLVFVPGSPPPFPSPSPFPRRPRSRPHSHICSFIRFHLRCRYRCRSRSRSVPVPITVHVLVPTPDPLSVLVPAPDSDPAPDPVRLCACMCCHPIYSGRQASGRTSWGHTEFLHIPSSVLAFVFVARKIQSSFSLVDREINFLCTHELFVLHLLGIFFFFCEKKSQFV